MGKYIIAANTLFVVFASWLAYHLMQTITSHDEIIKLLVPIIASIAIAIVSISYQYYQSICVANDHVTLNRPYLVPILKLSESKTGNMDISYLVENTGNYTATEVMFICSAPGFKSADCIPREFREIAPGSKIKYTPSSIPLKLNELESIFEFELVIIYKSIIAGTCKSYKSSYLFSVASNNFEGDDHYSISAQHTEGFLTPEEQLQIINLNESLNEPEGTHYFEFVEKEQNQSMLSILVNGGNKVLYYDPIQRLLVYVIHNNQGNAFILVKLLEDISRDYHKVLIRWNLDDAALAVDGDLIKTNLS